MKTNYISLFVFKYMRIVAQQNKVSSKNNIKLKNDQIFKLSETVQLYSLQLF